MSKKNPLVSIVIPVYNGGEYLQVAIDSALAQTYKNIEVIVVNDGSTDNTEQICLSYGNKIRYYSKENGGVADAVNFGISKMYGEYFSWLSHDDIYYPSKIERQLEVLGTCGINTAIVHGNYDIYNEKFSTISHIRNDITYSKERMTNSVFPVLVTAFHGCVPLIHKSHFERVGKFNEDLLLTQDYDFYFRAMRRQRTIFIEEPLVMIRLHKNAGRVVSKEFVSACANQYIFFAKCLTDEEIQKMFLHPTIFYYRLAGMLRARGFFRESANMLKEIKRNISKEIVDFYNILENISGNCFECLCIFGMGFQGKLLLFELEGRGVTVNFFLDNNKKNEGKEFNGIQCVSLEKILCFKQNVLVIVSPDDSETIVVDLIKKGFKNIIEKKQLEQFFLEIQPYNFGVKKDEMEK